MTDGTLVMRLLGPPEILVDGAPLRVDTRKAVAILAYLAGSEQPQAREQLAALLWPEADDASARGALRRTLSALRASLGDRWVIVDRASVRLDRRGAWADVWELGAGSDSGRSGVDLLRGEFMAGFGLRDAPDFDDWVATQAERWRQRAMAALDAHGRAAAAGGDWGVAVQVAERRLALDPLDEAAHRQLMELYARMGDRSAALRQYRALVRQLARELDVEPLPETTRLYESILAGEALARSRVPRSPSAPRRRPLPLVGRESEVRLLGDAWQNASVRLVLIQGEPGIGKSRLSEVLLEMATADSARSLVLRGYGGQRDTPFAPLVELLERVAADEPDRVAGLDPLVRAEVSRVVPRLARGTERPPPDDSPGSRARLVGALASALAWLAGDLLVVDDAQLMDAASLAVIARLARRSGDRRVLVAVARRPVAPSADALLPAVAEARRGGYLVEISPARLTLEDVRTLAAHSPANADASALLAESDGVPFYLVERLAALEAGMEPGQIPAGVRDLVRTRVVACTEVGRQILAAGAVIGRAFDPQLARAVSGRSVAEVELAIDELSVAGLLVARDQQLLDLDHELTRSVVLDDLGVGRLRTLHRRAADAARRLHGGQAPATVAAHLHAAGELDEAAGWYRTAGERATEVHAHQEAIAHFRMALALSSEPAAELQALIGDRLMRLGRYAEAASAYETAAGGLPPAETWRAELGLARAHRRLGNLALAEAHIDAAGLAAPRGSDPDRAAVLMERARIADRQGRMNDARAHADEALALLGTDETLAVAEARNLAGLLARHRGDLDDASEHLTESLRIAATLPTPFARMAALNNVALLERARDDSGAAEARLRQALAIAVATGDRHHEAALRNNLADALHAAGRRRQAIEEVGRSATIMAELGGIGSEPDEPSAEVWRLVDW